MNKSQQPIDEDESCVSVYLSFGSESVTSNAAYKTMMEVSSNMSVKEDSEEANLNSTLEANDNGGKIKDNKSVSALKKTGPMAALPASPLRTRAKNVMECYTALSSTPTKEQLLRNVDVVRGSHGHTELGLAFCRLEDEKGAMMPFANVEDKENAQPSGCEGSNFSTSSSMEIMTSMIEHKLIIDGDDVDKSINIIEMEEINLVKFTKDNCKQDGTENIVKDKKAALDHEMKNGVSASNSVVEDNTVGKLFRDDKKSTPKAAMGGKIVVGVQKITPKLKIYSHQVMLEQKRATPRESKLVVSKSSKDYKVSPKLMGAGKTTGARKSTPGTKIETEVLKSNPRDAMLTIPKFSEIKITSIAQKGKAVIENKTPTKEVKTTEEDKNISTQNNNTIPESIKQKESMSPKIVKQENDTVKTTADKGTSPGSIMMKAEISAVKNTGAIPKTSLKKKAAKVGTFGDEPSDDKEATPKATNPKPESKYSASRSSGKSNTRRSVLATNNTRLPVWEPNLQTNRPSRIVSNTNKRVSFTAPASKPNVDKKLEVGSEIPKLLNTNKMMKITVPSNDGVNKGAAKNTENRDCNEDIKLVTQGLKSRFSSMLPPKSQALKRTFHYPARMSTNVKTTLNSPARKLARKSILPAAPVMRRSVLPLKMAAPSSFNAAAARRSMLPVGKGLGAATKIVTTTLVSKQDTMSKTHRMTMYALPKPSAGSPRNTAVAMPKPSAAALKSAQIFRCPTCPMEFRIKSLLDAHKRSHEEDSFSAFPKKRSASISSSTVTGGSLTNRDNQCKYCDKKFALVRALHIHLLANCPKIPPAEKRKLHFTEMNHVEKAALPHFSLAAQSNNTTVASETSMLTKSLSDKKMSNVDPEPISPENQDVNVIINELVTTFNRVSRPQMPPPASGSFKPKPAHSGITRTPNKPIRCNSCKLSFMSVVEYTNHCMTKHSTQQMDVDK